MSERWREREVAIYVVITIIISDYIKKFMDRIHR